MLLRLFKGTNLVVIILTAIVLGAIWISAFLHPPVLSRNDIVSDPMPLYALIGEMAARYPFSGVLLSFTIVVVIAFIMVNFNTTSFFINERTYLPALFYILAGSFFPENLSLSPALPASLFLIFAIIRITDSYRKPGIANDFFDAGILISTGSLFYASLIWFGILVIIGIATIRTVNWSEVAVSLIGLATPYAITSGIMYLTGKDPAEVFALMRGNLFAGTGVESKFSELSVVILILVAAIVLVSMVHLINTMSIKKIKSRNTFLLLIWTCLISLALYFILPAVSYEMMWITAIPAGYFLAHYFIFVKKGVIPEILFYLLLISAILMQIFPQ